LLYHLCFFDFSTDETSGSGIISSPNWPASFSRTDLFSSSEECEWDIITETHKVIQINVMDIDFPGSGSCSLNNYLKLKGEWFYHYRSLYTLSFIRNIFGFSLCVSYF